MHLLATMAAVAISRPDDHHLSLGPLAIAASAETTCLMDPVGPLALFGDVFSAAGDPVSALAPGQAQAIVTSGGRWLVDNFWGRYVAFWLDPRDGRPWVLRDPSGAVPLYCQQGRDGVLVFTSLAGLPEGRRLGLAPDPDGLAHRLAYPSLPTQPTALAGISEILPGQSLWLDDAAQRAQLWSPWRFAQDGRDQNPAAATAAVRGAVENAVAALTLRPKRLLLELSGGLDSSIVAASLAAAPRTWRAATLVTPGADGDERAYARAVADRWQVELAELSLGTGDLDLLTPPVQPGVAPSGYAILAAVDGAFTRCAGHDDATLISGTGGDNVFCALRSAAPLLDRFQDQGVRAAYRTLADLARLTQASSRQILTAGLRYWRTDRQRPVRWLSDTSFLAASAIPRLVPHPWLARPPGSRPGTRAHIAAILRAHAVTATLERARTGRMLFPLLAQPVMEACLAIPSWRWIEQGVDRAVARAAFADRLPASVLARRTKGRLGSLLAPAYDRDRKRIGERLCDGQLAAMALVDRDAIARAIVAPAQSDGTVYMRLLELLDAELWASAIVARRHEGSPSAIA